MHKKKSSETAVAPCTPQTGLPEGALPLGRPPRTATTTAPTGITQNSMVKVHPSRRLSFKIVVAFVVLMAVMITSIGIVAITMLERFLMKNIDDELISSGKLVATQIVENINASALGSPENRPQDIEISDYYLYARVWDSSTRDYHDVERVSEPVRTTRGTPAHPTTLLRNPSATPHTVSGTKNTTWRTVVYPVTDADGHIVGAVLVARPLAGMYTTRNLVTKMLLFVGIVTIALGGLIAAGIVTRSLAPLRAIEKATHKIAAGDLSQRVPSGKAGSEVAALSDSINTMLAQIEHAFDVRVKSEAKMRQFVSDASHELRTPLATVRGYAELYRLGGVPDDEVPATIERIESEAGRMSRLVEDLLQLARLDEGRPLDLRPVNLAEVCRNAVADFHARDTSRDASLCTLDGRKLDEAIAAGDSEAADIHVIADADKATQVVSNLLSNVLTHTPAGTACEVRVGYNSEGNAQIEVIDHGLGVSGEDRARLFERFYRADSSRSRSSGGSGLGMAIVAAIMASHGGSADLEDTPGGGLTVRLIFPVSES